MIAWRNGSIWVAQAHRFSCDCSLKIRPSLTIDWWGFEFTKLVLPTPRSHGYARGFPHTAIRSQYPDTQHGGICIKRRMDMFAGERVIDINSRRCTQNCLNLLSTSQSKAKRKRNNPSFLPPWHTLFQESRALASQSTML